MRTGLEFGLLGVFRARRGEVVVPLPARPRTVLAALLLAEGRPVAMDALVDVLWGDDPPGAARSTLQVHVLRVRRALGEDLVRTRAGAYLVPADAAVCDVTEFRDLLSRARDTTDREQEHAVLTGALALWRGPVLADVDSEALRRTEGTRLDEQRLDAVERRAELALALGKPDEVVADMTAVVAEHPLREMAWAHLLSALRHTGRRAEAMAAYHRVRTVLRAELGVEPHPRVQAAHQAVLADEQPVAPAQLPSELPVFVGRRRERAELVDAVARAPLVVLSGPPGVGKTALAVHVAHRVRSHYPDGQLHADLRGFSADDPLPARLVLERFLRALGLAPHQVPADEGEQVALYRSLLSGRRVLVVLDNAGSAAQVRPFVPGAGSALLVTSREAMPGLAVTDGASHVRLAPLTGQEARDLLTTALGARAAAEPDAIGDLTEVCGGLPLALRIAAANLAANPHLAVSDYRDVLRAAPAARLRVGDGEIAVSASFDLSYERLSPAGRELYRLLGVLPGADFSRDVAVAAVPDSSEALDRLVTANLVTPSGSDRYQVHDLIRGHASARAEADTTDAANRALDFYLHTADNATRALYPDHQRPALSPSSVRPRDHRSPSGARAWLNAELANLVACAVSAHHFGRHRYERQVAEVLRGHLRAEGLALWREALSGKGSDDLAGLTDYVLGHYREAIGHHRRALSHHQGSGDHVATLTSLHNLARAHAGLGHHDNAIALHTEAIELGSRTGSVTATLLHLNHLGFAAFVSGRLDTAEAHHRRALELAAASEVLATAHAWNGLGLVAWARGDLTNSISAHQQACDLATGDHQLLGFAQIWLAMSCCEAGLHDRAVAAAEAGIAAGRTAGDPRHEVVGTMIVADVRRHTGADVLDDYASALRRAETIGFAHGELPLRCRMASVLRDAGDPDGALGHADRAVELVETTGVRLAEPDALIELGLTHRALGAADRARACLDRAVELAAGSGQRLVEARARHHRQ
ncbi:tetratricopeptide repeat protein [Lentzea tibetensis]|uniref:Tetratricopeptide repeat protein n=1 Tax=Lentzea tibetensis TaxID=2591470 RepID=A0A563EGC8_9PSEU|nr:AfsR/SARP family transcriptional regulator [Lentzea tibetensis]TWP45285.1 tetratricopeptide repeat protein [Lentzea tibetensis]